MSCAKKLQFQTDATEAEFFSQRSDTFVTPCIRVYRLTDSALPEQYQVLPCGEWPSVFLLQGKITRVTSENNSDSPRTTRSLLRTENAAITCCLYPALSLCLRNNFKWRLCLRKMKLCRRGVCRSLSSIAILMISSSAITSVLLMTA